MAHLASEEERIQWMVKEYERSLRKSIKGMRYDFEEGLVRIYPKYPLKNILKEVKIDSERDKYIRLDGVSKK